MKFHIVSDNLLDNFSFRTETWYGTKKNKASDL